MFPPFRKSASGPADGRSCAIFPIITQDAPWEKGYFLHFHTRKMELFHAQRQTASAPDTGIDKGRGSGYNMDNVSDL